jgi:hypothetical protein
MSARNKIENKNMRRGIRLGRNRPDRVPVGNDLPDDLDRLADPKGKLGSPIQKMLMRARGSVLIMPEAVGPMKREKASARFSRLTYAQLCRCVHQYRARAAGAHNKAEKLVAGSRFADALNRLEAVNLFLLGLVKEELFFRTVKKS